MDGDGLNINVDDRPPVAATGEAPVNVYGGMHQLHDQGEPFVTCTLLSSRGHAPQNPGAKALVTRQGLVAGTIGGGKLEARAIREAVALLADIAAYTAPMVMAWDLQKDIGMSCGGSVTVLLELCAPRRWRIAVFGAGHVAQALCRTLVTLPCQVICVDTRTEWVQRLPAVGNLAAQTVSDMAAFAAVLAPGTFCVVVSMGHAVDLQVLKVLVSRNDLPFIGSMGSKVKARAIKADLIRAGLAAEQVRRLHCPIGLALGSREPCEIAISITAQLLLARDQPGVLIAREPGSQDD